MHYRLGMAKTYKCTFDYLNRGQQCALGLHYQWDGDTGSDEPPASDLATRLDSHLRAAMRGMLGDTVGTLERLVVREEVEPGSGDVPDIAELLIAQAGTYISGDGHQAPEVVPLFKRKTAAAVKGAQSWCFGPSPNQGGQINSGLWDSGSGWYGQWQTFVALLDDDIAHGGTLPGISGTYHPVAYSETRRRRSLDPYTFQVTTVAIDPRPRWLRSRGA